MRMVGVPELWLREGLWIQERLCVREGLWVREGPCGRRAREGRVRAPRARGRARSPW